MVYYHPRLRQCLYVVCNLNRFTRPDRGFVNIVSKQLHLVLDDRIDQMLGLGAFERT